MFHSNGKYKSHLCIHMRWDLDIIQRVLEEADLPGSINASWQPNPGSQ